MLFRRGQSKADAAPTQAGAVEPAAGKGRPTPTRKEAEAARKQRVKAPATGRRQRSRGDREAARTERARIRAGLMSGDERALPARDKGPVRRFARDYVDAHRTIGEFMLPSLVVLLPVTLFTGDIKNTSLRNDVVLVTYIFMILVVGGTAWLAFFVKRAAAGRFPDQDVTGVGFYAAMRSLQLRRWRLPKPQVRAGQKI